MISDSAPSDVPRVTTEAPDRKRVSEPAVLDHEYDGIREYDNPMPGWWVATFWATFVFSLGYVVYYYVSPHGVSVEKAYSTEMAAVRAERARRSLGERVSEDSLEKLMLDGTLMTDAKTRFLQRCQPCHGDRGQGTIGPNLTDDHWLHGKGTLMDIHATVSEGVPQKGMPAWGLQLNPVELRMMAAFVGSLRGQKLPGKAPEGTLVPAGH